MLKFNNWTTLCIFYSKPSCQSLPAIGCSQNVPIPWAAYVYCINTRGQPSTTISLLQVRLRGTTFFKATKEDQGLFGAERCAQV